MRQIIKFFIKQPIWANAIIVVTVMFGLYNLLTIKKSFFPELDPRRVIVSVSYPGASPEEMEEGVTIKIEQALRGIDGVEQINSTSSENFANITVFGFEDADMDAVFKDVENGVNSINSYPQGAEKPLIRRLKSNPMSERVSILALSGDCDLLTLKNEADKIENDLFASGLISNLELRGFPELELVVNVRENDLLKYNLLIDEIALAIQRNNQDLTGGVLKGSEEELIIRSRERTTDPEELEKIVLRTTADGQKITIGDVADVVLGFSENSMESFKLGKPAITIEIKKTPDQDLGLITDFVRAYVIDYNDKLTPAKLTTQYEFSASLDDRIKLLTSNGMVGLLLVLLMLGLFLSSRLSLWVAFGIPFSFLGMFIIAAMMGLTINMITLFGMILVVGILVDDGIVIAENIYVHFEKGKNPYQAALDGTMEVVPSVFTSVLTTIAAFSILLFIDKMEMMREMSYVVILALAFSLIEAFIILPVHLASKKVLSKPKEGTKKHKFRETFTNGINFVRDKIFGDTLNFILKRYRAYVLLPLLFTVFIVIFSTQGIIKYTFFPEIKPDIVNVEIGFVPGTARQITKDWLNEAERIIIEANQELAEETGDTLLKDYSILLGSSQNLGEAGFHTGMLTLTIDGEGKVTPVDSLNVKILSKLNKLESTKLAETVFVGGGINTFGKPIEYSFSGNDKDQVKQAKNLFKTYLTDIPLVSNLKDNEPLGRKEIGLKIKPEADFYGLGVYEISKQLRQGIFGQEVQRVIVGTDEVKIWVRYAAEDREDKFDMDNIRIKTMDGKQILLSELATYTIDRGPVSLKRRDGRREIVVDASVDDPKEVGTINEVISDVVIPKVLAQYPGIEIIKRGQAERSEKAVASMQINLMILLVIMTLIVSLNFKSVFQALLILLVIPAGVAGGILGHVIVGIPVSILSAFGMIALIGVLINDAIVFLDTYNRNLIEGMGTKEAVISAAKSRFRPIVLTSITTVAGLLPLIMETSFQAQFLIPMATSIAFGILFGTVFILLFFPTIILVHNDFRRVWNHVLNHDRNLTKSLLRLIATHLMYFVIFIPLIFFKGYEFISFYILMPLMILLPNKFLNKGLKWLWGGLSIKDGKAIEPAILNLNEEQERDMEM
jgi:multidrug efflux pump subunit AcrB